MRFRLEVMRAFAFQTAWQYDQVPEMERTHMNPLAYNFLHILNKETSLKFVEHACEVWAGLSGAKGLPIEGYIRSIYNGIHGGSTADMNRIFCMKLI
jgi:alkylation response protein AidB-like acyl-CoA dehydrogenase